MNLFGASWCIIPSEDPETGFLFYGCPISFQVKGFLIEKRKKG